MRVTRGRRLVYTALALLALVASTTGGLAIWVTHTPSLRVREVRIEGTSDPTLVAAIRALPLAGCLDFQCDTARDVALVERLPAVARASVTVAYPTTLVVRVLLRQPILLWRAGNQPYLVAGDGVLVGPAGAADDAMLPEVDDPTGAALGGASALPGARLPAALVGMAMELLRGLPATLGSGTTLRYEADVGLVADDGRGLRVAFGDPSRPPDDAPAGAAGQLAELRALLDRLASRNQRAVWIDLRWGMHPAYRLASA